MQYPMNASSVSITVQIADDAGLPVAGILAASWPSLTWVLAGPHSPVAFPSLSDLGSGTAPWVAGGVYENGGGFYRLDLPNAIFAVAGEVTVIGEESGKHVLAPKVDTAGSITPSSPGFTTGYFVVYDSAGNPEAGVTISSRVMGPAGAVAGIALEGDVRTAVSDSGGLVQFQNLFLGLTYQFFRGPILTTNNAGIVTIPTGAGASYALPAILGVP